MTRTKSRVHFAGYALLLWQMPQAIITVSVMTAVLPRISDGGDVAVLGRAGAVGLPMATLLYSGSDAEGARGIGRVLMAFGPGLVPYSVQYVVLRGFYTFEDTRTPFYNTVVVALVNAGAAWLCFTLLPPRWAVTGMAASYGAAFAVGVVVAWRRLRARLGGDLDGARVLRTYGRLAGAAAPAAAVGGGAAFVLRGSLGGGVPGAAVSLFVGGGILLGVFLLLARLLRVEELNSWGGAARSGRGAR
ncbi:lipid II flippase MurJ [Streptomyces sp. SGAir0957]